MTEEELTQRRTEIRAEIQALLQEYLQMWEDWEESLLVGYIAVMEYTKPEFGDYKRGRYIVQAENYSPFAAKGLLLDALLEIGE